MNPLAFFFARLLRREGYFQAASRPEAEVLAPLKGKRVALVGNARALADGDHGAAIDGADVVVRLNGAPMPAARSHGTRTDWLAVAFIRLYDPLWQRLGHPRLLWISPKLHRLTWTIARQPDFYRYPVARYHQIKAELGPGPSTGLMVIDLLSRSDLAELRIYGFDFFASHTLSNDRPLDQIGHDGGGEAAWAARLFARDPRLIHVK